ncbi:MAG: Lrp/AsnC family transcriptional regulator [Ignavibacteria bacterium]|nr:Lrp/AsnC family transcriptional regulator [Ignavibacteria bacterium]
MDKTDSNILSLLQENARITNAEIARQIGMVPSGVQERIRKLEEKGYISDYATHLSSDLLDLGLLAFIFVRTSETPGEIETAKKLAEFPEILEIHHVAGEDCYLLKVRLADNKALASFMREKFRAMPEIKSTNSVIVLETVKETCKLNLPESEE